MAYKDEYEVARLYTDGAFLDRVREAFTGEFKLRFHLAPPLIARRDKTSGELKKGEYGPWILRIFRTLAKLKFARGTPLDIFGYTAERRMERQLIRDYEATIEDILDALTPENHHIAVEIASIPEKIRGYGHVKLESIQHAASHKAALLEHFRNPAPAAVVSAAE